VWRGNSVIEFGSSRLGGANPRTCLLVNERWGCLLLEGKMDRKKKSIQVQSGDC